jgi:hypothetical protein
MSRARFGLQATFVLSLFLLVGWTGRPQGRAASAWRPDGPFAERSGGPSDRRLARNGRYEIGYGSARIERTSAAGATGLLRKLFGGDVEGGRRYTTPPGVLALGGRINAIVGSARTTLNAAVPHARLLLLNLATGEIEARATAGEDGQFTFLDIMPSGYVVELIGPDGEVIATSEFVAVGLGDLKKTMVRAADPQGAPGAFGTLAATVDEPLGTAADSGVHQVSAPDATMSPQR